nr:hypothetical protein [Pseudomonas sp. BIGb0427]
MREIQQQLERDTKGSNIDSAERNHEVRIKENRQRRLAELVREDALPEKLFRRLDDDERGGLDYTLALVEMLKDRLENEGSGIIPALEKERRALQGTGREAGVLGAGPRVRTPQRKPPAAA